MSTTISARIPDELVFALNTIAKETDRSKSYHIQKAIEIYLNEYADVLIAQKRLNDASDPVMSMDDMREIFGV